MKKLLFVLPVMALMICCQPKENTNEENNSSAINETEEACGSIEIDGVEHALYSVSEEDFNDLKTDVFPSSDKEIIDDTKNVKRTEGLLTFALSNGEELLLKDKFEEFDSDVQIYRFVKSYDKISYWLYDVAYYEGCGMYLLDKDNGDKLIVWGMPVFSPDNSHFVTNSMDIEAGYQPNGMQLFEVQDGKVSLIWKFEVSDWGPESVRWIDNETIAIKKSRIDYDSQDYSYISDYVKLRIK